MCGRAQEEPEESFIRYGMFLRIIEQEGLSAHAALLLQDFCMVFDMAILMVVWGTFDNSDSLKHVTKRANDYARRNCPRGAENLVLYQKRVAHDVGHESERTALSSRRGALS